MRPQRLLPYLVALALLAWILGSLARSGTGGGSLLSNSVWLVYLVELSPLVAVGLMIALLVSLIRNWRLLSDALGFQMAKRPVKKKNRSAEVIVWMASCLVAVMVLFIRCGGIICKANASAQDAANAVNLAIGNTTLPNLPSLFGPVLAIANVVDTNYLAIAFLGVLGVSSVIMVRAFKVSWDETRNMRLENALLVQQRGQEAVQDAIRVFEEDENADPRMRILHCYQMMINAAGQLGAPVGPDRTARELEKGIRGMFQLKGTHITTLTRLFEEARYSLHAMTEENSLLAHGSLLGIREELGKNIIQEA